MAAPRQRINQKVKWKPMLFRFVEVVSVLTLIVALLVAKYIPVLAGLPLSQATGIVCFAFAIFLSLRIYLAELARIRAEE